MSRRYVLKAGTALAVVALGAAACGGGSSGGGSTGTTGKSGTKAESEYNGAINNIVQPSDKKGGTLNFLATSDFDSLDPARTYYAYSWNFQRIYQRTLLAFDAKPGKDGDNLVPDIATGKGEVSNGGKTITYKILTGLKFSDGEPITTDSIKYALERPFAADVINGGPTYLKDILVGGASYKGPYKDKKGLSSIHTTTDTISFDLVAPFSDFDYLMALPSSTPVPMDVDQSAKGGAKYQFNVVSTGPYKIQNYAPGKSLVLVRNENWDASTDKLRKALPDTIKLTEGLDPDDMDKRLLAGTGDIEIEGTGVQPTAVASILPDVTKKKYADNPNTGFTRYISIQTKVAPLDNVHCRRAVQYAANKVLLQNARGGPVAGGDIASTMLPPTLPAYKAFNLYPSGSDNKGDIANAKKELALCGKPNGFTTNIASANKGKGQKVAVALQEGLAAAGIKTNLKLVDSSTYYSGFIGVPSSVKKNQLGLAVAGWGPDFPTEYGFFESIVDGRAIKPDGGNSNYAELNDPTINGLIDKAKASNDASEKKDIWGQVDQKVMESAALLPFVYDKALDYHNPRVTNVYINGAFGQYDLVNMGVNDGK